MASRQKYCRLAIDWLLPLFRHLRRRHDCRTKIEGQHGDRRDGRLAGFWNGAPLCFLFFSHLVSPIETDALSRHKAAARQATPARARVWHRSQVRPSLFDPTRPRWRVVHSARKKQRRKSQRLEKKVQDPVSPAQIFFEAPAWISQAPGKTKHETQANSGRPGAPSSKNPKGWHAPACVQSWHSVTTAGRKDFQFSPVVRFLPPQVVS